MSRLPATEETFGPADGDLTLHTTCTGAASRLGHDLTLLIGDWQAAVTPAGDDIVEVTLTAELSSLSVVRGEGGAKPLSEKDKKTIVKNALETLKAREHPTVSVRLDGVSAGTPDVVGAVTIAGVSHPVTVTLAETGTTVLATAAVVQSDFGVQAYSTMLGALKVRDAVTVRLEVRR